MNAPVSINVGIESLLHVVGCTLVNVLEEAKRIVTRIDDLLIDWVERLKEEAVWFPSLREISPLLEERPHVCDMDRSLAFQQLLCQRQVRVFDR